MTKFVFRRQMPLLLLQAGRELLIPRRAALSARKKGRGAERGPCGGSAEGLGGERLCFARCRRQCRGQVKDSATLGHATQPSRCGAAFDQLRC